MAQPVYTDHPLESYLRQSGEGVGQMPGAATEFIPVEEDIIFVEDDDEPIALALLPPGIRNILETTHAFLTAHSVSNRRRALAERFKYDVISSTLLSSTLASPHAHFRRPLSPDFPGHLRNPSTDAPIPPPIPPRVPHDPQRTTHSLTEEQLQYWGLLLACAGSLCAAMGFWICGVILMAGAIYPYMHGSASPARDESMQAALDGLHELASAGSVWDASVQEAIEVLENEERNSFYAGNSASSPSSALRVALNSSLHTTRTQCEKVRQLFAALTTPAELSQLSEMYAPTSPTMSGYGPSSGYDLLGPSPALQPVNPRKRTVSNPTHPGDKRSTWSGSYTSLAQAGSATMQALLRREKRRSDLAAFVSGHGGWGSTASAPVSPRPRKSLEGVREERDDREEGEGSPTGDYFGAQALDLRKRRRISGMETLGVAGGSSPPRATHGLGLSGAPTLSSSSRLTSMPSSRHPLSLSALHHALSGAIAAKRHACSHLLALQFDVVDSRDDETDYWEDVRSVMALLTSTFADASARLVDALDAVERQRLRDETPTEASESRRVSGVGSSAADGHDEDEFERDEAEERERTLGRKKGRTMQQMVGFAPMPSHIVRFGAHVDAISSALDEARGHLEHTVAALRGETPGADGSGEIRAAGSSDGIARLQEAPALKAYERLRRELGYALRECERGRERLLDIIAASLPHGDSDGEDVPALAPDAGSDGSSEKVFPPSLDSHHPLAGGPAVLGDGAHGPALLPADGEDDASAHLLLTAGARHLPPPGIEQVFEADAGAVGEFLRERSKLTRAERVALAKAHRERAAAGVGSSRTSLDSSAGVERGGPGVEVVQELKDVIWKVSERRRKIAESAADANTPTAVPNTPVPEPQVIKGIAL